MKKMRLLIVLTLVLSMLLGACSADPNRPLVAGGNGQGQTTEKAVNDANSGVKAFFDQAQPVVTTVVTSLTGMANTIFSAVPGLGVNSDEVEKLRQQIRNGGAK